MCRARRAKYSRDLHAKIRAGIPRRVPMGPVKKHVNWLIGRGMSAQLIAEVADVSAPTMMRIKRSDDEVLINATIADALLAVDLDMSLVPPGAHVDSTGSRRRVQGLAFQGFSLPLQAERIGVDSTSLRVHKPSRRFIRKENADSIRDMFDEWWDQEPPSDTPHKLRVVRFTKTWAKKMGFVPPMAWCGVDIDDPNAVPDLGDKTPKKGETVEEIRFLRSFGKSEWQVAQALGLSEHYVRTILKEAA